MKIPLMETFLKYLKVYIKTMKKAGTFARPIGFRAKKFALVVQCLYFSFIIKSFHFHLENNTWFSYNYRKLKAI